MVNKDIYRKFVEFVKEHDREDIGLIPTGEVYDENDDAVVGTSGLVHIPGGDKTLNFLVIHTDSDMTIMCVNAPYSFWRWEYNKDNHSWSCVESAGSHEDGTYIGIYTIVTEVISKLKSWTGVKEN